jgi:hypothetical protein
MASEPITFLKVEDAIAHAKKHNLLFVWGWKSGADDIRYRANNSDHDSTRRLYWDAATDLCEQFMALARAQLVTWTEAPVPEGKEGAMRAILGKTPRFNVLVAQARIVQVPESEAAALLAKGEQVPTEVQCHAMLTTNDGKPVAMAKMPREYAEPLYQMASVRVPPPKVEL